MRAVIIVVFSELLVECAAKSREIGWLGDEFNHEQMMPDRSREYGPNVPVTHSRPCFGQRKGDRRFDLLVDQVLSESRERITRASGEGK